MRLGFPWLPHSPHLAKPSPLQSLDAKKLVTFQIRLGLSSRPPSFPSNSLPLGLRSCLATPRPWGSSGKARVKGPQTCPPFSGLSSWLEGKLLRRLPLPWRRESPGVLLVLWLAEAPPFHRCSSLGGGVFFLNWESPPSKLGQSPLQSQEKGKS